ncbi:MAG TPA: hypothetical protein VMM14_04015 [Acidimicrobiia bacterium]|nr:hypothetical protein [Acidimicrobiia bacterium]
MKHWSAEEAATHRTGVLSRSALASIRDLGRPLVSPILYALALIGVPVAVVLATGGPGSIGFWIVSLVWVAAVAYGAIITVFVAILVLSPILLVVDRILPVQIDSVIAKVSQVAVAALAGTAFLYAAQLGDGSEVRLPTDQPNAGALLVMVAASMTSYGLWTIAGRLKQTKQPPAYTKRHSVPEPDQEYWSNEYVVAWRSWGWDGSSLRGVYSPWRSSEMEASCRHCDVVPSWDHVCGVYAVKSSTQTHVFHGGDPIVGLVEMWGDVIEHQNGYRASHARITDLWVDDPARAGQIRAAYPTVHVVVGSPGVGEEVS